MDANRYPVLNYSKGTPKDFVLFWWKSYSGYDDNFYRERTGKPLTKTQIEEWFVWKNGRKLSAKKDKTIRRYSLPKEGIDSDADAIALKEFLGRPGGAIWRIFWLHLQHPSRFPIYDQHVHRAMEFLLTGQPREIPSSNPARVRKYLEVFCPFFERFSPYDGYDRRQVDQALWGFGRFLKSKYAWLIGSPPSGDSSQSVSL